MLLIKVWSFIIKFKSNAKLYLIAIYFFNIVLN